MTIHYKKCTIKDFDLLVKIARETFITAYEKHNEPEVFKRYLEKAFSVEKIKKELLNKDSHFYFAYLDEDLIGYFKLNTNQAQNEQFEDFSVEIERIYVLSNHQNKGFGKLFLDKCIALAKVENASFLWLGVWDKNEAAIRFYERHSFKKFSTHPFYMENEKQIDFLLKLVL